MLRVLGQWEKMALTAPYVVMSLYGCKQAAEATERTWKIVDRLLPPGDGAWAAVRRPARDRLFHRLFPRMMAKVQVRDLPLDTVGMGRRLDTMGVERVACPA